MNHDKQHSMKYIEQKEPPGTPPPRKGQVTVRTAGKERKSASTKENDSKGDVWSPTYPKHSDSSRITRHIAEYIA